MLKASTHMSHNNFSMTMTVHGVCGMRAHTLRLCVHASCVHASLWEAPVPPINKLLSADGSTCAIPTVRLTSRSASLAVSARSASRVCRERTLIVRRISSTSCVSDVSVLKFADVML